MPSPFFRRIRNSPLDTTHLPVHPGAIRESWQQGAERSGYTIVSRVISKDYLLVRCNVCGGEHVCRYGVVANHSPVCPHCIEIPWRAEAEAAGLRWLGRDEEDRHSGRYLAPCGHEIRRQFGLVKRMAEGETGHRCEICHAEKEISEAKERGWTLIGADPQGELGYRLYRHDACGAAQRVARANMQTGRFDCATCGVSWTAASSYLYAMRFILPGGLQVSKLGFSKDPTSRLDHQLKKHDRCQGRLLRAVPMPNGHVAIRTEKRLHVRLKRAHPDAIVPAALYRDHLRVKTEIYYLRLEPTILGLLDHLSPADGTT